jgi:microcystin degradation protein MlrC
MRIGIIGILHESNTFVSRPTTIEDFERESLLVGDAVRSRFEGSHHELGGFFAGLDAVGLDAVPLLAARALPSGTVTEDCWQQLLKTMLSQLAAAGPLDGVLVAPHGATVSAAEPDADGNWLRAVRQHVGEVVPIIGTLDAHANLSPAMVAASDALLAYRTNPHLDQQQRGVDAARLMRRTLDGEVRPCMRAAFPRLAINIERQMTSESPLTEICAWIDEQRDRPNVLSNSLLLGFPYADVEEMGCSAIVVTDNDFRLAEKLVSETVDKLWTQRAELVGRLISIEEAIDRCEGLEEPICLLDMGDNVGGGSAADGTLLAHALRARRIANSFVCLYDPVAVRSAEEAGVGVRCELSVGGKTDRLHGSPLAAEFVVRSLHEGRFQETQVRHGGIRDFDQGRTAIVETDSGLTVMLTSQRMVPFSLEQLRSCDLDPASFRILVAKGVNAPLAAYREVCPHFVRVNTAGSTCADMMQLDYRHRRRPMFPWEEEGCR